MPSPSTMIAPQVLIVLALLSCSAPAQVKPSVSPRHQELPVVRNIGELDQLGDIIPGLSHITVAGAVSHGFKEIEVWLQTVAPGGSTPVHRHDCEEVFVVLKGSGSVYLASNSHPDYPGNPQEFPFSSNSTFHIPQNEAHQVTNTNEHEDLQFLAVISRPPMKLFVYENWFAAHSAAKLIDPIMWDAKHYKAAGGKDEL